MFETEISLLESSYTFETEDMFDDFEEALKRLLDYNDPRCIPVMLRFLRDEGDYPEMMYQIIHAVESFPLDIYLTALLKTLKQTYETAPELAKILIYRVLNREDAFEKASSIIKDNSNYLKAIAPILQGISNESAEHQDRCYKILDFKI